MISIRPLFPLFVSAVIVAGCSSSQISTSSGGSLPRSSTWSCTDGARLTIQNQGNSVFVTDTRGVETDLPADPPGQRIRYGKTGYALVFDGRNASWFASGKRPADCRR